MSRSLLMMGPRWQTIFGLMLVGTATVVAVSLWRQNSALRERVVALRGQTENLSALRSENQRLRTQADAIAAERNAAEKAHEERFAQARAEIAALENQAKEARRRREAGDQVGENRDPEKGLAALEHFSNAGRETPGRAFQTFVWAAMSGHDQITTDMCFLSKEAREVAEEYLAKLPESARVQWTPEKLGALLFSAGVSQTAALSILSQTMDGSDHAEITIRTSNGREEQLQMQRGAAGWQVVVTEKMIRRITRS